MKCKRLLTLCLTLTMLLSTLPFAAAAEGDDWLIPRMRDYAAFTDTAGTICEEAADIRCKAGLMDGVDSRHFLPQSGLTHAQIIVISARFHRLLSGGTLDYFEPISLTGADWWTPYDGYLRQEIPSLASSEDYASMTQTPTGSCHRGEFLTLLAAVLKDTGTTLPEINQVSAVPDCQKADLIAFYRWGVLSGKDEYGTLEEDAALTRAAAAAMLARLVAPSERLTLDLKPLDVCRDLLGTEPETVLMTIGGQDITAEQFAPTLVSTCSSYNHSHFASWSLEMSGRTTTDEAVDTLRSYMLCETLARELDMEIPACTTVYQTGYRGLTAQGQTWTEEHRLLEDQIVKAQGSLPADRLPDVTYAPAWETVNLTDIDARVAALPYWGGYF
ncbi:MAG: hypothetical protein V8R40_12645 [Dysosmobacter sp.]